MVTYFNKKDLVEFGEYLLSDKRNELVRENNRKLVHHADIENFLHNKKHPKKETVCVVYGETLEELEQKSKELKNQLNK